MQRKRLTGEQRAQLLQEQKQLREQFVQRVAMEREEKRRAEAEARKQRKVEGRLRNGSVAGTAKIGDTTIRFPAILLECVREIAQNQNVTSAYVVRSVVTAVANVDAAELMRWMKIAQDLGLNKINVAQHTHNATQGETR